MIYKLVFLYFNDDSCLLGSMQFSKFYRLHLLINIKPFAPKDDTFNSVSLFQQDQFCISIIYRVRRRKPLTVAYIPPFPRLQRYGLKHENLKTDAGDLVIGFDKNGTDWASIGRNNRKPSATPKNKTLYFNGLMAQCKYFLKLVILMAMAVFVLKSVFVITYL